MCGRKTLTKGKLEIIEELSIIDWDDSFDYEPSWNIAPTQNSPILILNKKRSVIAMRWGLIPFWAKDLKIGSKLINARAETLTEKPSFKNLLARKRCIVIADGYFEWQKINSTKIPNFIHKSDGKLTPFAGLWDKWQNPEGHTINSYTIITTEANQSLHHIHNRMPVILDYDQLEIWLNIDRYSKQAALEVLSPCNNKLVYHPVSKFVNSPKNNSPDCIIPENTNI